MRSLRILTTAVSIVLVIAACSSSNESTTQTSNSGAATPSSTVATTIASTTSVSVGVPVDYAGYRAQPTACDAEQPDSVVEMEFAAPGDAGIDGVTTIVLETSCGPIEILVEPNVAPETVNSFAFLAESGFFDGSVSHRIIPGFMMQAGDPTATGLGGPGYAVPDEFPPASGYSRGVVAMANAGPGTTGSQFFIMFGDAGLPPSYSIFGEVVDGFETLDLIEQLPLGRSSTSADPNPSTPLESLYIESVAVIR